MPPTPPGGPTRAPPGAGLSTAAPRPSPTSPQDPAPPRSPWLEAALPPGGSLLFQHAQNPLIVRCQNRNGQPFPPRRNRRARYRRERRRRLLLCLGRGHGSGLASRACQGLDQFLDQFLARDHPPVPLDLRGLQHLSQPRDFLTQALHPHADSHLPLLQHSPHRRHRAPLGHEADTRPRRAGRRGAQRRGGGLAGGWRGWPGFRRLPQPAPAISEICGALHRDLTPAERSSYLPDQEPRQPVCPARRSEERRAKAGRS